MKVLDVEKVIDISSKLAARTTDAKWTLKFLQPVFFLYPSNSFFPLTNRLAGSCVCCILSLICFMDFLHGSVEKFQLIEPWCEISIT